MIGLLLIGSAAATALLLATAARFQNLVSTLLAAYLAYAGNLGITTLALSPFRWVTRTGLGITQGVLLAGALAAWWWRGRPALPLAGARASAKTIVSDPIVALFLVAVLCLLGYELALGLSVPPNNGDALFYHLPRAATWAQHGGIFWIPNSPNVELNEYQPLAEQQLLYLFVSTASAKLFALPQFLGELVVLAAVYGSARRLGFGVRPAACSALLLATFSVFALEAMTGQNDLVSASFVAAACYFLLCAGRVEFALGGAAAAFALGTKLTTGLVLPTLVLLALARGRRTFAWALAGGIVGFGALGMWGYVLNDIHTGHLLGVGTALTQDRGSPSYPGSVSLAFYLMYGLMDLSILSNHLIRWLALAGIVLGALAVLLRRRHGARESVGRGIRVALPFVSGMVVIGAAAVIAWVAYLWGFPIRGADGMLAPLNTNLNEQYTHLSHEDYSAFGPVGIVALVAAIALTLYAAARRRADVRQLVLATALPLFLVLISLSAVWVPFLIRFFVLPAVIVAPLLARLFRGRAVTAAYAVAACTVIGLTIAHDQTKPLQNPYGYGRPWDLTMPEALVTTSRNDYAGADAAYEQLVPSHACVGAVMATYDPSFLLFGTSLDRRVFYLPGQNTLTAALARGVFYVVLGQDVDASVPASFESAGWRIKPLGSVWHLATDVHGTAAAAAETCTKA